MIQLERDSQANGRIEHVISGKSERFSHYGELIGFILSVLQKSEDDLLAQRTV